MYSLFRFFFFLVFFPGIRHSFTLKKKRMSSLFRLIFVTLVPGEFKYSTKLTKNVEEMKYVNVFMCIRKHCLSKFTNLSQFL